MLKNIAQKRESFTCLRDRPFVMSDLPQLACCNIDKYFLFRYFDSAVLSSLSVLRSLLMFTMENCFYVLISQAVRCLKDPAILPRDKQRLKQELSSELVSGLSSRPSEVF